MTQLRGWIGRRPIVSFYLITFAITFTLGFAYIPVARNEMIWLAPLAFVAICAPGLAGILVTAVGGGQGRPSLRGNPRRWIAFLVALAVCTAVFLLHNRFINGATITPALALVTFFLLAPPVAFILSAAYSRGTAVRAMMGSLVRLRGVSGWALAAVLFMPGVMLLSILLSNLLGRQTAGLADNLVFGAPLLGLIILKFLYQWFFFNATGEESGWSGFARRRLQARVSPLAAALIVTLFWMPWHFLLWYAEGREVLSLEFWLGRYLMHVPVAIIISWLFNRSRGSILVAGAAHAAANTADAFLNPLLDWPLMIAMTVVVALLLVLMDRMWERLPQEDPAVSATPRLAI